jgi:DnaJ-class molecular chaperone
MADKSEGEECMPCRGTGKVISNLGGTPQAVTCPWCRGGGVRLTGIDAQTSGPGDDAEDGGDEGSSPDAAA